MSAVGQMGFAFTRTLCILHYFYEYANTIYIVFLDFLYLSYFITVMFLVLLLICRPNSGTDSIV